MSDFDRTLNIFDLVLMLSLSTFQLFDILNVDVLREGCHSLLPSRHRIKLLISVDTFLSSIKELFTHFE
jgi:hypothetical protein